MIILDTVKLPVRMNYINRHAYDKSSSIFELEYKESKLTLRPYHPDHKKKGLYSPSFVVSGNIRTIAYATAVIIHDSLDYLDGHDIIDEAFVISNNGIDELNWSRTLSWDDYRAAVKFIAEYNKVWQTVKLLGS